MIECYVMSLVGYRDGVRDVEHTVGWVMTNSQEEAQTEAETRVSKLYPKLDEDKPFNKYGVVVGAIPHPFILEALNSKETELYVVSIVGYKRGVRTVDHCLDWAVSVDEATARQVAEDKAKTVYPLDDVYSYHKHSIVIKAVPDAFLTEAVNALGL